MLQLLDVVFLIAHIGIVFFNLFGWIWIRTRKSHFVVMTMTLISWIGLGWFYGFGYCFLTDWHWNIKRQLGESNLPNSFIKYAVDEFTPFVISADVVDLITGVSFGAVVLIATYLRFFKRGYK